MFKKVLIGLVFLAFVCILISGCAENPMMPVIDDHITYIDEEMNIKVVFDFAEEAITVTNNNTNPARVWIGREVRLDEYVDVFNARVPGKHSGPNSVYRNAGFAYGDQMKMTVILDGVKGEPCFFKLGYSP